MEIELAKSIIQKTYRVNGDQKIRTENPIRIVDLAAMMEDYHQQRVKNNASLDDLKKTFTNWSGYELEGKTEEELISSINSTAWSLECEIDSIKNKFIDKVKKLNLSDEE